MVGRIPVTKDNFKNQKEIIKESINLFGEKI